MSLKQTGHPLAEERYKFVTSQLHYFADRMRDTFKLYVQLTTGISAGYVWLQTQDQADTAKELARTIGPGLLIGVGALLSFQIAFDYRAWYRYRKTENEITGGLAPQPVFPGSASQEICMVVTMLCANAAGAFYLWMHGSSFTYTQVLVAAGGLLVLLFVVLWVMAPPRVVMAKAAGEDDSGDSTT